MDYNILKKNERGSVKHRLFLKIYDETCKAINNRDSVLMHLYSDRSETGESGSIRFYL